MFSDNNSFNDYKILKLQQAQRIKVNLTHVHILILYKNVMESSCKPFKFLFRVLMEKKKKLKEASLHYQML